MSYSKRGSIQGKKHSMTPSVTIEQLVEQQVYQEKHDNFAHFDVFGLRRVDRLKHLTLHLAKYVGRLSDTDDIVIRDTIVDAFLITISIINSIEIDLGKTKLPQPSTAKIRINRWAPAVGRIAKSCEAMDHLEWLDYRSEISSAALDLLSNIILDTQLLNIDLDKASKKKRADIESKIPSFKYKAKE